MSESSIEQREEQLRRLLQLAGPRPEPSPEMRAAVYAQVHAAWRKRLRRRWALASAVAAAVALVAFAWTWSVNKTPARAPLLAATVEKAFGELSQPGVSQSQLPGTEIFVGQRLRTGENSGAALRLVNGAQLRLDQLSNVSLDEHQIHLQQGRIYVDTGRRSARVEIRTSAGVIRNLGTRFEVLANGGETRVRVRDGAVQLATPSNRLSAQRGEALQADRNGVIRRSEFSPTDPHWKWIWQLATPFETDQASIAELARWVADESGRSLDYADAATRNAAQITYLNGSIYGLPPLELLNTALLATRFQAQVDDRVITLYREQIH